MAKLDTPIRSSASAKVLRDVISACSVCVLLPLALLLYFVYDFGRLWGLTPGQESVGIAIAVLLLIFGLSMVGVLLRMHCRWLEFDGVHLRGAGGCGRSANSNTP